MNENKPCNALFALRQKFPDVPDVRSLSDEKKAWLQMKIQSVAGGAGTAQVILKLQKIRNRLVHATEDVGDRELQKMVTFVFSNMDEIEKLVGKQESE